MEIEIGVRRLERRDAVQGAALRAWKDRIFVERFKNHWIPVDLEIAERCAALHVPDPRPPIDALIAATAIVKRLTLVTRNERDFAGLPVELVNPWAL
jgi:predicted nucleic acid-binding protein